MNGKPVQVSRPFGPMRQVAARSKQAAGLLIVLGYVLLTYVVANLNLNLQSLILVAAVFGILAISLDLVAGTLGLYSLGQGGFFAIGAYATTLAATDLNINVFVLLPIVLAITGLSGMIIGAMSLRVSGLYFAITTFIFTLIITVLATDLQITGGTQGLLGPAFPSFPQTLDALGSSVAWCAMLSLFVATALVWNIRKSPLYPVLLAIRDAEPFAEAAGARTALIKIGVFGLSAALAGFAGWIFSFLGVVSPGQFDWAVSLNILVMVLLGGINTTLGPLFGIPGRRQYQPLASRDHLRSVVHLRHHRLPRGRGGNSQTLPVSGEQAGRHPASRATGERACPLARSKGDVAQQATAEEEIMVECRGIEFGYGTGPKVAAQCGSRCEARPHPRPYWPQRLRQKHACECHRRPAAAIGGNDDGEGTAGRSFCSQ